MTSENFLSKHEQYQICQNSKSSGIKCWSSDFSHARYSWGGIGERTVVEHRKYLTKEQHSMYVMIENDIVCPGNTEILEL